MRENNGEGCITPFPLLPTLTESGIIIYIVFYIEKKEREEVAGKTVLLETKPISQEHTPRAKMPLALEMRCITMPPTGLSYFGASFQGRLTVSLPQLGLTS